MEEQAARLRRLKVKGLRALSYGAQAAHGFVVVIVNVRCSRAEWFIPAYVENCLGAVPPTPSPIFRCFSASIRRVPASADHSCQGVVGGFCLVQYVPSTHSTCPTLKRRGNDQPEPVSPLMGPSMLQMVVLRTQPLCHRCRRTSTRNSTPRTSTTVSSRTSKGRKRRPEKPSRTVTRSA